VLVDRLSLSVADRVQGGVVPSIFVVVTSRLADVLFTVGRRCDGRSRCVVPTSSSRKGTG